MKSVLDICCGSRMFWFDKTDSRALFLDNRSETKILTDRSHGKLDGRRIVTVRPDVLASFEALPFADSSFPLVVFDPPHDTHGGVCRITCKYGKLPADWRALLSHGFRESFRVLAPLGTLVFKWSEISIPVSEILKLTDQSPLFGQRCGATAKTHWLVFQKALSP